MSHYKQVTLYAIRGHFDHDILEHTDVTVKLTSGNIITGNMFSVESDYIRVYDYSADAEIRIPYDDILNISDS